MPKYLVKANYVGEGVAGLLEEGGAERRKASEQFVENLGGRIEAMYYAFGETDLFVIIDLPDNVAAAACSLAVNASGRIKSTMTPLLTPEEVDQAAAKGKKLTADFRAPGR